MIQRYVKTAILVILTMYGVCSMAQQQRPSSCGEDGQGLFRDWYYEAVLHLVRPPDWQYLISISFSSPGETKYILRMTVDRKFELLRGTPEKSIVETLEAADHICALPLDPFEALGSVHFNWRRVSIPQNTFEQLDQDFTRAVAKHVSNAQSRYGERLKSRAETVYLHTPVFKFAYDDGVERMEIESTDSNDERGKNDPLNIWAHSVLKLAEGHFAKQ